MFGRKPQIINVPVTTNIPAAVVPKPTPRSVVVVDLFPDDIVVLGCDDDLCQEDAAAIRRVFSAVTSAKAIMLTGDLRIDAILHTRSAD